MSNHKQLIFLLVAGVFLTRIAKAAKIADELLYYRQIFALGRCFAFDELNFFINRCIPGIDFGDQPLLVKTDDDDFSVQDFRLEERDGFAPSTSPPPNTKTNSAPTSPTPVAVTL